jgi:RecB family endonuclease NucS
VTLGVDPGQSSDLQIGKIRRVALREVWRHEALDFTTWLELNADVLSDALGVTIDNVERERSAGSFSVDLVGEDESGHAVVIENQLERSDHDHLGKLITYLAAFEAKTRYGSSVTRVLNMSARSCG